MSTIDDVMKLQQQGKSEKEIIAELQEKGISAKVISDSLAQTRIKAAVAQEELPSQYEGMEQSVLQPNEQEQIPYPTQTYQQSYQPPAPSQQTVQEYQEEPSSQYQYESYQPSGISTDTIAEISEQVVAEKFAEIRKHLERTLSFQSAVESKIDYLDERLKRIEKTIDRLQLSILQKVGDYMTSVSDVRRELSETQKSFKSLLPQLKEISGESHKRK